jgi:hypothetical protein
MFVRTVRGQREQTEQAAVAVTVELDDLDAAVHGDPDPEPDGEPAAGEPEPGPPPLPSGPDDDVPAIQPVVPTSDPIPVWARVMPCKKLAEPSAPAASRSARRRRYLR